MAIQPNQLNEKLMALLSDQVIAGKLGACKSPEECYEVAKGYVSGISFAEFQESMTLIRSYLDEKKDGLLDVGDMENVAGGANPTAAIIIGGGVVAASAAVI